MLTPSDPPESYAYALALGGYWERDGWPVSLIVRNIAGVSEEIAHELHTIIHDKYAYRAAKEGWDNPYGFDAYLEEREPLSEHLRDTWETFRRDLMSHMRFFSPRAEKLLNDIFGDLTTHKTLGGKPVIREVAPDDEERFIWRARRAHSTKELNSILKSPVAQLGPPPSRSATGGRMNAPGIPVFYGAMEQSTCISEVRAPVGSYVVLGRFEIIEPLRLLDFDALRMVYVSSHFDPDYMIRHARSEFLNLLVTEICKPVMPQDEELLYLPTQAVAEYLANQVDPPFDGIVFPSSQTEGIGSNVVLFNHACLVEQPQTPHGIELDAYLPGLDNDYQEYEGDSILIVETAQPTPPDKAEHQGNGDEDGEDVPYGPPTLRLDLRSVEVLSIKSATYNYRNIDVTYVPYMGEADTLFKELI